MRIPLATAVLLCQGLSPAAGQPPIAFPPGPTPLPLPPPTLIEPQPVVRPAVLTVGEFARAIQPLPGKYEVTLVHPKSGRPVQVCFTLSCDAPCKVTASKHALRFDYKRGPDVVIRFRCNGTVSVRDDD